jgi:hypothetical protein
VKEILIVVLRWKTVKKCSLTQQDAFLEEYFIYVITNGKCELDFDSICVKTEKH